MRYNCLHQLPLPCISRSLRLCTNNNLTFDDYSPERVMGSQTPEDQRRGPDGI